MTTIATLVATAPDPTFGAATGFTDGAAGTWRHVVELADPDAGASVEWFDITEWFAGYEYTRGADSYLGRYRASVAHIDLWTDDDRFAPWNDDTSATFGVHVDLGPGLLIRSGFIRVSGGVVAEWNPRFTLKVESWGDASYSRGRVRQHRIVARDTLTALVGVPIPADTTENWTDRITSILTGAGWVYGSTIYGPTTIGGVGVLPMPDRDEQPDAIVELDATTDPAGAVWYTNRKGQLIVRPSVYDTYLAGRFTAGAAGTPYPTADPTVFAWWACTGEDPPGDYDDLDTDDVTAYALDTEGIDPFGLDRSELGVVNHVVVTSPSGTFDDDDPTSIQRYDRHTFQASWITANDFVAADILAARANATIEARPLTTQVGLPGFHLGASYVDVHDDVDVWHRNGPLSMEAHAAGWLRGYREQIFPRGCDTDWTLTLTLDVFETTSRDPSLLPVENLTLTDVTELVAAFTWTNPTQVVTPTNTQVRMSPSAIWLTLEYPLTGLEWGGLAPYTPYEFEVRLIRQVDGIITHHSPTRSVVFMTDTPDEPIVDHDGDDTATVTFPDPGDCDMEWELQSSPDGVTWTTIDDGTITTPPFELVYDTSALDAETFYRFQSRDVCGGVPGAWTVSDPFVVGCLPVTQLGDAPYDDADLVAYWPQVCPPDAVAEAVSDQPMTFGGAFDRVGFDDDALPVLYTFGEGVIGYGVAPAAVAGSSDLTIACRVNFGELPAAADVIVFAYAGLYFSVQASGSGWTVEGHALEAGVGTITITSATVQDLDTVYDLVLSHDVGVAAGLRLYVNGELADVTVAAVGDRAGPLGDIYQIGAPADSWVTDCAVWDRVLDPAEIPGYTPSPAIEYIDAAAAAPGTVTTYTPAFPGGYTATDGDVCILHVRHSTTTRDWSGTGWTEFADNAISVQLQTFWRVIGSADVNLGALSGASSTASFTWSIWRGVDTTTPIDVLPGTHAASWSTAAISVPDQAIVTEGAREVIVAILTTSAVSSMTQSPNEEGTFDFQGVDGGGTSRTAVWYSRDKAGVGKTIETFSVITAQTISKNNGTSAGAAVWFSLRPQTAAVVTPAAAPTVVGVNSAASGTVSFPGGTTTDDFVYSYYGYASGGTSGLRPGGTGWQQRVSGNALLGNMGNGYILRVDAETQAVYTGTVTGALAIALRGVDPRFPIDHYMFGPGTGTPTQPTTRWANSLAVMVIIARNTASTQPTITVTSAAGYTTQLSNFQIVNSGTQRVTVTVLTQTIASASTLVPTPTWTAPGGSTTSRANSLVFKGAP